MNWFADCYDATDFLINGCTFVILIVCRVHNSSAESFDDFVISCGKDSVLTFVLFYSS